MENQAPRANGCFFSFKLTWTEVHSPDKSQKELTIHDVHALACLFKEWAKGLLPQFIAIEPASPFTNYIKGAFECYKDENKGLVRSSFPKKPFQFQKAGFDYDIYVYPFKSNGSKNCWKTFCAKLDHNSRAFFLKEDSYQEDLLVQTDDYSYTTKKRNSNQNSWIMNAKTLSESDEKEINWDLEGKPNSAPSTEHSEEIQRLHEYYQRQLECQERRLHEFYKKQLEDQEQKLQANYQKQLESQERRLHESYQKQLECQERKFQQMEKRMEQLEERCNRLEIENQRLKRTINVLENDNMNLRKQLNAYKQAERARMEELDQSTKSSLTQRTTATKEWKVVESDLLEVDYSLSLGISRDAAFEVLWQKEKEKCEVSKLTARDALVNFGFFCLKNLVEVWEAGGNELEAGMFFCEKIIEIERHHSIFHLLKTLPIESMVQDLTEFYNCNWPCNDINVKKLKPPSQAYVDVLCECKIAEAIQCGFKLLVTFEQMDLENRLDKTISDVIKDYKKGRKEPAFIPVMTNTHCFGLILQPYPNGVYVCVYDSEFDPLQKHSPTFKYLKNVLCHVKQEDCFHEYEFSLVSLGSQNGFDPTLSFVFVLYFFDCLVYQKEEFWSLFERSLRHFNTQTRKMEGWNNVFNVPYLQKSFGETSPFTGKYLNTSNNVHAFRLHNHTRVLVFLRKMGYFSEIQNV